VTSRVINLSNLFVDAPSIAGNGLESWNTSLVTTMYFTFKGVRTTARFRNLYPILEHLIPVGFLMVAGSLVQCQHLWLGRESSHRNGA
jgi:Mycoplasma protein of unknown function, DUF285